MGVLVGGADTADGAEEIVLLSTEAVESAFEALQSGQVLRLDVAEVVLSTTLLIEVSNVELRGRPGLTRMLCPSDGSVLIIR